MILMDNKDVICSNCLKKFTTFIVCTECRNIRLCFTCFSSGVESSIHKKYHSYRFESLNTDKQNIFDDNWSFDEELRLLYALEQFGVGNWEDVSLKVETKKASECLRHYCIFYLGGLIGFEFINLDHKHYSKITDHTASITALSPERQLFGSLCLDVEDQQLLGYMPDRGDFERDYDNDAESILCRLHPSFSHDELEDALKVAQVIIYIQRLRERQRRKDIAREHGLITHILAFILNKRLKKRALSNYTESKFGIRRKLATSNSMRNVLRSKIGVTKTTPMRQSNKQVSLSSVPPPGSWLAAPFTLQSSGANKGAPLVSGLSVTSTTHNCLNEKLKPFLRYFTGAQGKNFIDSLYKEELLKHEIEHLMDLRSRGKVKLTGQKFKFPLFKSSVYQVPQRTSSLAQNQLPNVGTTTLARGKKRRRTIGSTPWYVRVQRKSKNFR